MKKLVIATALVASLSVAGQASAFSLTVNPVTTIDSIFEFFGSLPDVVFSFFDSGDGTQTINASNTSTFSGPGVTTSSSSSVSYTAPK
jgi:hypothetical protein